MKRLNGSERIDYSRKKFNHPLTALRFGAGFFSKIQTLRDRYLSTPQINVSPAECQRFRRSHAGPKKPVDQRGVEGDLAAEVSNHHIALFFLKRIGFGKRFSGPDKRFKGVFIDQAVCYTKFSGNVVAQTAAILFPVVVKISPNLRHSVTAQPVLI